MRRVMTITAVKLDVLPLVGEVGLYNPRSAPRRAGAPALTDAAITRHRTEATSGQNEAQCPRGARRADRCDGGPILNHAACPRGAACHPRPSAVHRPRTARADPVDDGRVGAAAVGRVRRSGACLSRRRPGARVAKYAHGDPAQDRPHADEGGTGGFGEVAACVPTGLGGHVKELSALASAWRQEAAAPAGSGGLSFALETEAALLAHVWPGNMRELRHRVSRGALLATRPPITREDMLRNQTSAVQAPAPIALSAECHAAERMHVRRVVLQCGGRIGGGARMLAISRATLGQRKRRLGLASMEEV